jgi:hypothetical protein
MIFNHPVKKASQCRHWNDLSSLSVTLAAGLELVTF